jgi:Domain of unknown function (DUF932)
VTEPMPRRTRTARSPGCLRAGFTPIRVVCANTFRMAHNANSDENKLVKLLHTKNVTTALDALRDTMRVANSRFEATAEQYRKLASYQVSYADLRRYVKIVLGVENENEYSLPGKTMTKLRSILMLAQRGRGNKGKTLWDGYNGVTEYGRTHETRLDALWFGASAQLSQKALDVALTMAV